jgi:hypothetical protein
VLTIDLAFRPIVNTNITTGFFSLVRLDGTPLSFSDATGSHATLGPVDIAAGSHSLQIIAVVPLPHTVFPPGAVLATAFDLNLTLVAVSAIPEPGTWVMVLSGMAVGLVVVRRRKRGGMTLAV